MPGETPGSPQPPQEKAGLFSRFFGHHEEKPVAPVAPSEESFQVPPVAPETPAPVEQPAMITAADVPHNPAEVPEEPVEQAEFIASVPGYVAPEVAPVEQQPLIEAPQSVVEGAEKARRAIEAQQAEIRAASEAIAATVQPAPEAEAPEAAPRV